MAEALAPHLVGTRPNTYTFTKSIAEALVGSYGGALLPSLPLEFLPALFRFKTCIDLVSDILRSGYPDRYFAAINYRLHMEGPYPWLGRQLQW